MALLTSGTTGTPKGVPRNKSDPTQSAQLLDRVPWPRDAAYYIAAPLFHATGLATCALGLALGNRVVMTHRFDPEATLKAIAEYRVGAVVLVPTMLQRILDLEPDVLAKYDTSSLTVLFAAGSSLSPDLCRRTHAAATATSVDPYRLEIVDGLLSSGDTGHFDETGLWFIDGRDDDMIVSGGENVFPLEVENLLADHPDVVDAVKSHVRAHLARHKIPRDVGLREAVAAQRDRKGPAKTTHRQVGEGEVSAVSEGKHPSAIPSAV
jgi:fatty-acyl-CoA synthase